jgi:hypothetical protein
LTYPELVGQPSRVFGDRFPYPLNGKQVMFDVARRFAAEFNQQALGYLEEIGATDRKWQPLTVTSAYPTSKQHCPRIAVIRQNSAPKLAGLGGEIETIGVQGSGGEVFYKSYRGNLVTDTVELSISTINELMRDDIFTWLQQYVIDAIGWMLPSLTSLGTYEITCTNASDDQVEYQGTQAQPGFEFYVGRLEFRVTYDLVVVRDVDRLREVVNWQNVTNP